MPTPLHVINVPEPEKREHVSSRYELRSVAKDEVQKLSALLGFLPNTELETFDLVSRLDVFNAQYDYVESEAIYSRLAATYLPRLVDNLFRPIPVIDRRGLSGYINGYVAALEGISRFAPGYLVNFMLSTHPETAERSKRLPRQLAQLVGAALLTNDPMEIGNELTLYVRCVYLSNYQAVFSLLLLMIAWLPVDLQSTVFSPSLKRFLITRIHTWEQYPSGRHPHDEVYAHTFNTILEVLDGKQLDWKTFRHVVPAPPYKPARCKFSRCLKALDMDQMYLCARCQSALYCCKPHQVSDWDDPKCPHGAMCYPKMW